MSRITLWLACALLALAGFAQAQTPVIWRCGADGRSFSDVPCAKGQAVPLPDPRPAADVEAARELAVADQRRADTLRRERLLRESMARAQGAAGIGASTPAVTPVAGVLAPKKRKLRRLAALDTSPATARASRHN